MKRRLRLPPFHWLALVPLIVAAACGSDSPTNPNANVVGVWNLTTINGAGLPFTFPPSQGVTVTVTASVLTLSDNGTYNEILSLRSLSSVGTTLSTLTELGTWNATNGAITFHDQTDNVTYQGSVSGGTLTEINNGYTQVYARR